MKLDAICAAVKEGCEKLPVLFCDYSLSHEIRCKKAGKKLAEMTSKGTFEVPVCCLILAALILMLTAKCCFCASKLIKKCTCGNKKGNK